MVCGWLKCYLLVAKLAVFVNFVIDELQRLFIC